jgi:formate dehydrogenase gamma subunit
MAHGALFGVRQLIGISRPSNLRFGGWLVGGLFFAAVAVRAAEPPAAATPAPNSDASCLECHSDDKLTMMQGGRKVSLFVEPKLLAQSPHSTQSCIDCHEGFDAEKSPHKRPMTKVDCTSCHEKLGPKHAFHPRLGLATIPEGKDTACTECHGTHGVAKTKSAEFPFNRTQQAESCGRCHEAARDEFRNSAHGLALQTGTSEAPDCLACHRQPIARLAAGQKPVELKLAQVKLCESCHVGKNEVAGKTMLGTGFVASFDQSVHGAALHRGVAGAASCIDCHGSHAMNLAMVAGSRINQQHISATCAKCHEKTAGEYDSSVHAAALRRGNLDSPSCTRCHGEHDIRAHTDPNSPVYAKNVAQQVCAECHASVRLTKKYGLASDTFQTFTDSFHGLAVRGGSVTVVNCASCHSTHAIKSQNDPTSTVHKSNLVATCGRCHPGANTRFTVGSVHANPESRQSDPILYWIATLYIILIVGVVGGMAVHNFLDFFKKARRKLAIQKGLIEAEPVKEHRLYLRMTAHERCQHGTLVLSFFLLVITGFALRYPEAWWVVSIQRLSTGAFAWRGIIHRVAGVVMLTGGVWHIAYLAFTKPGRQLFRDLLPRWNDLTDPIKVLRYNLGLSDTKPQFGRFSYIEKSEYWALVWGTLIMGATGAVLWFDNTSMGLFTKLGFDISRTIHFYEAILATLAIIVWHFYFVIFNPDIYPMNLSWLTGRMSEEEMHEEHPLELERLKEAGQHHAPGEPMPPPPTDDAKK